MDRWNLKNDKGDGRFYLTREEDGFAFANPQPRIGRAKQTSANTITLTEKRHKSPTLELRFLRWHGIEGAVPLLPEALDGKTIKITIEVLP